MNEFIVFGFLAIALIFFLFQLWQFTQELKQIRTCNHEKLEKIGETTVYDLDMNVSHEYKLKCINCDKIITVVKDGK